MESCSKNHERSNLIPIVQKYPTIKKEEKNILSLKQNFFDPTKSSPPNDFLLKLRLRMSYYDSFIKADSLNNE
jgi:hypothetical protein